MARWIVAAHPDARLRGVRHCAKNMNDFAILVRLRHRLKARSAEGYHRLESGVDDAPRDAVGCWQIVFGVEVLNADALAVNESVFGQRVDCALTAVCEARLGGKDENSQPR